jgi:hypothetical protein
MVILFTSPQDTDAAGTNQIRLSNRMRTALHALFVDIHATAIDQSLSIGY